MASSDPAAASTDALALAEHLGLSFTVAEVLRRRGYGADDRTARFLDPKLAHLTPPDAMAGRDAAVARIARAIRAREPTVVFGDYDCDGITATAILQEVIEALGGDATALLANRFAGGYGLSDRAFERVRERRPSLLCTCDCGSTDHERITRARAEGIDVVVIDHHEVPNEPLPAHAFVNPHQSACAFPEKGLASCGLVLLVAAGLRRELGAQLDLRRWLDLVAIGTVADAAPLVGDNRVLVRAGLRALDAAARPGLRALARRARRGRAGPATAEFIAYQLAPRLNAPGRLGDPQLALDVCLARDAAVAAERVERAEQVVVERRRIQRTMLADAIAEIARERYDRDAGLVLARQDWHPGVVGIVAGRLASQYGKPSVVIALEGPTGRGSVRGPPGFDLHAALGHCAPALTAFGGHRAAAGLELQADAVPRLRALWVEVCGRRRDDGAAAAGHPAAEVRLDPRDDLMQVVGDLERLEPCGEANPAPRLLVPDVDVRTARPVGDHLKLELEWSGHRLSGFAPERGVDAGDLSGRRVSLVGRLRRDHWRGGGVAEVLVDDWEPR